MKRGRLLNTDFQLREAELSDVARLIEISVAARGSAGSDPTAAVLDDNRLVLVVELDGELVAWGKTHFYAEADGDAPSGHYLGGVNVLPEFRRRGIGWALVDARVAWILERADAAYYFTNARNAASIALHWQFTEIARASTFHGASFDGGEGILFKTP